LTSKPAAKKSEEQSGKKPSKTEAIEKKDEIY
jgi:hypothetical protein